MAITMTIVDGPDKPALQWALTYPEEHGVHFRVEDDGFDAQILRMEEQGNGLTFNLTGRLTSGDRNGFPFDAIYSIESRSGSMTVKELAE